MHLGLVQVQADPGVPAPARDVLRGVLSQLDELAERAEGHATEAPTLSIPQRLSDTGPDLAPGDALAGQEIRAAPGQKSRRLGPKQWRGKRKTQPPT
jgi:hypothetical protein